MSLKKILIADDHPVARFGISNIIKQEWPDVEIIEAADGCEVLLLYEKHTPEVLLLDYRMPRLSGFEAAEQLLEKDIKVKIMLLTMYDSIIVALNFLKIGGKGFLDKGCNPNEIIGAIRSVLIGDYYFHSTNEKEIIAQLEKGFHVTLPNIKFTMRDLEIVLKISRGMTSKQIGESMNLSIRSIETYRYDMIRKAQVSNSMELIDFIYRVGISQHNDKYDLH